MIKVLTISTVLAALLAVGPVRAAQSEEFCYTVSTSPDFESKTPELLCLAGDIETNEFTISLKTGLPWSQKTVAIFNFNFLSGVKCIDCNKNVFGVANPENSTFNTLSIAFDGTRDMKTMKEKGTVTIGKTKLFYHSH